MPETKPAAAEPETYFPARLQDQQTRKSNRRSGLASLFGAR
jgi:hypothetical protein